MTQLLIAIKSGHSQINRGDTLNIHNADTIEYGPGCRSGYNLIVSIPCLAKQDLIDITDSFKKEYIETFSSTRGLIKTEVRNTIPEDAEEWTEVRRRAKKMVNFEQLIDNSDHRLFLMTCTKEEATKLLTSIGEPCIYRELNALRVSTINA